MRIFSSAIILLSQASHLAAFDAERMQRLVDTETKRMSGVESPEKVAQEVDEIVQLYERMADHEETDESDGEEETNDDFNFGEMSLSVSLDEVGGSLEGLAMKGDPLTYFPTDMPTFLWVHMRWLEMLT